MFNNQESNGQARERMSILTGTSKLMRAIVSAETRSYTLQRHIYHILYSFRGHWKLIF